MGTKSYLRRNARLVAASMVRAYEHSEETVSIVSTLGYMEKIYYSKLKEGDMANGGKWEGLTLQELEAAMKNDNIIMGKLPEAIEILLCSGVMEKSSDGNGQERLRLSELGMIVDEEEWKCRPFDLLSRLECRYQMLGDVPGKLQEMVATIKKNESAYGISIGRREKMNLLRRS